MYITYRWYTISDIISVPYVSTYAVRGVEFLKYLPSKYTFLYQSKVILVKVNPYIYSMSIRHTHERTSFPRDSTLNFLLVKYSHSLPPSEGSSPLHVSPHPPGSNKFPDDPRVLETSILTSTLPPSTLTSLRVGSVSQTRKKISL